MLTLRKVAVTGGLSSGKSLVCRFFQEFGAYVLSSDEIVHQLLSPETRLGQEIIDLLGSEIIVNQKIDRSKIAEKVFSQPTLLKSLESLIHPEVQHEIDKHYKQVSEQNDSPLFVVEVPLLFESGMNQDFDMTIAVIASEEKCRERFIAQTQYGPDEFDKRAARQMPSDQKAVLADIVIRNNDTKEKLKYETKTIYKRLLNS